jgi:UDP-2,3-diacylglucosamine pyrophosphatase LpxH
MKNRKLRESKPRLISIAEATTAIQWLEEFMQGDSPDAAQARVVCGLIRGLQHVADMNTGTTPDANREEAAKAAWREYCTSGQKPDNVPANPDEVYKDSWTSWCDWLGWYTESVN